MLRILMVVALAYSVSAGLAPVVVAPAVSYASGPALGAPLLGRTTYTAPEVTVVKQPITVDQHEVHYKSVPTLVQPQVVVAQQPLVQTLVGHQTYVAQPHFAHLAQPQLTLV